MYWRQTRRTFINWCIFIFVAPPILVVLARAGYAVGFVIGQSLTFLNLMLLNRIAPEMYRQLIKDNAAEMQLSQIGGSVVGICTCLLALRFLWRWLYANEERFVSTPLGVSIHFAKRFINRSK